jgi:chemotaxis protein methyltransferase CheR
LLQALAPGGWLITASSDPPLADEAPFEVVTPPEGVFYRRPSALAPAHPDGLTGRLGEAITAAPARVNEPPFGWFGETSSEPAEPPALPARPDAPAHPSPQTEANPVAEARAALRRGDYARAAELVRGLEDDPAGAALRVRALAGLDPESAERACAAAVAAHPLATELAYLHAVLLVDLGRQEEAAEALRRVLYLDGSLAVAHFTLGWVLDRLGDAAGARRAYRNAHDLAAARPPDEPLPLAEGETAGHLAEAAAALLTPGDVPAGRAP